MSEIIKTPGPDAEGKSFGHCYDGAGWKKCSFWYVNDGKSWCMLFSKDGIEKENSKSLVACDRIYGLNYQGPA